MWVRVATFEGGDTAKLDKLMDERMSSGEMTLPEGMSSVLMLRHGREEAQVPRVF